MTIYASLSLYWLLLPLAAVLALWVNRVAATDTGWGSGLATIFTLFKASLLFLVAVVVLLLIDKFTA